MQCYVHQLNSISGTYISLLMRLSHISKCRKSPEHVFSLASLFKGITLNCHDNPFILIPLGIFLWCEDVYHYKKRGDKKFLCIYSSEHNLSRNIRDFGKHFSDWMAGKSKDGCGVTLRQNFDVVSITHQAIILPHPNDWIDLSETDRYVYYSIGKCKTVTTWVRKEKSVLIYWQMRLSCIRNKLISEII